MTLREDWVKALRSGKYEQGQEFLRCEGKFCCLGVLADITPGYEWVEHEYADICMKDERGVEHDTHLPFSLLDMVGLDEQQQSELIDLNDRGISFSEIADKLENDDVFA